MFSLRTAVASLSLRSVAPAARVAFATPCKFVSPVVVQARGASRSSLLGDLSNVPSSYSKKIRRGRGPGSGKGKTAGRGTKGQKARSGKGMRVGFEGGQTPITRLFPKVGFHNVNSLDLAPLNLNRLQMWIKNGRIDGTQPITMKELLDSRCVHSCPDGVKLLGDGAEKFTTPITIYVSRASDTAIAAVEAAGGKIYTVYHNRLGLRSLLKPYKFAERGLPKQAQPTRRDMIEYYKNPKKRGFLANEEEGKNEYHALLALKGVEGKMPKAVEA